VLLFKELTLLCFDAGFTASLGFPVRGLDLLMLTLVTAVVVIGLQAVGLVLVIAFLIIPAAAARFWTERLWVMAVIAAGIGAVAGWLGSSISALVPRLPAGAVIVLACGAMFLLSLIFGQARGVLVKLLRARRLNRRVARQNLLRAFYEAVERARQRRQAGLTPRWTAAAVTFDELLPERSWSARRLKRLLHRAQRQGLVKALPDASYRLTERGYHDAARLVRNHRLWEQYLVTHADTAPALVDRDADRIEHVLSPEMISRLERLTEHGAEDEDLVPESPHPIASHRRREPQRAVAETQTP